MKTAKPILLITHSLGSTQAEMQANINHLRELGVDKDYYILIVTGQDSEIHVNVFYEKDFNEVKYEELKQIILDKLK